MVCAGSEKRNFLLILTTTRIKNETYRKGYLELFTIEITEEIILDREIIADRTSYKIVYFIRDIFRLKEGADVIKVM